MFESIFNDLKRTLKQGDTLVWLIGANALVFAVFGLTHVVLLLSMHPEFWNILEEQMRLPANWHLVLGRPWTVFTYMFYHQSVMHLLGNLLFLYWFGQIYQLYMNSNKLALVYLLGGVVGAAVFVISYNVLPVFHVAVAGSTLIGASAGVMAVMFAAAALNPDHEIHILGIFTVPIKYVVGVLLLLDIISISNGNAGGYLAHCGGALAGWLVVQQLRSGRNIFKPIEKAGAMISFGKSGPRVSHVSDKKTKVISKTEEEQRQVDDILDKISRSGYNSLSKHEKEVLFQFGKKN